MKNLTIIIHSAAQQALGDSLRALKQVEAFTFSHVEGHSRHAEEDPFLSARDKVVGYVPRVRVDILLASGDVDDVLAALIGQNNLGGQGRYWVTTVEQHGRL